MLSVYIQSGNLIMEKDVLLAENLMYYFGLLTMAYWLVCPLHH
jgi:hypothetical protein